MLTSHRAVGAIAVTVPWVWYLMQPGPEKAHGHGGQHGAHGKTHDDEHEDEHKGGEESEDGGSKDSEKSDDSERRDEDKGADTPDTSEDEGDSNKQGDKSGVSPLPKGENSLMRCGQ